MLTWPTSDIIVGFPARREDFRQTLELVGKSNTIPLHFPVFERSGTPAAEMEDPVSAKEKARGSTGSSSSRIPFRSKHRAYIWRTVRV